MKKLGIDISKQAIAGARSTSLPQVTGGFDYQYISSNPANMISPKQYNWSMGVAVTVPIFDGFAANAKVKEARAKYSEAVLSKEDFEEQVALEVRKGCLDIIQADAIIASQRAGIEEAREALKIANVSYESGVATNLDVLDAQVSLSQVEENLSEAIYDHIMAKAYLARTMGKSSLGEEKDEKPDKRKARKNKGK
jgi:outer membrane protein TolC